MIFFTKKIIISNHAKKRYVERVSKRAMSDRTIRSEMLKDFQVKAIRKKTPKDEKGEFKLWVHGARMYVIVEKEKSFLVKTVIQMLPSDERKIKKELKRA